MISLGGYASEILFYDGIVKIGGDDLISAVKLTESMLAVDGFRTWLAGTPVPPPSTLDIVENPLVRTYIKMKLDECVHTLNQVKPAIQLIADELYKKDELTGAEISALFDAFIQQQTGETK
jgi:hypothetical protein